MKRKLICVCGSLLLLTGCAKNAPEPIAEQEIPADTTAVTETEQTTAAPDTEIAETTAAADST